MFANYFYKKLEDEFGNDPLVIYFLDKETTCLCSADRVYYKINCTKQR